MPAFIPQKLTPKAISAAIALVALLWIGTGVFFGSGHREDEPELAASGASVEKLLKIEERESRPYTRRIVVNGNTRPNRMVEIKPEVEGRVMELPVKKGSMVKAGQLIVRLDDRDRRGKYAEAKAAVDARMIEYNASQALEAKGYRPRIGLAQSKAALEQARAMLAQAQLNLDNTQVRAPFAGRLEELNVEVGDFVLSGFFGSMNGVAMARLVEDDPIKVTGRVSEKDLPLVNRDAPVDVTLSDGRTVQGHVTFLGQYADEQSRSFPVEVTVANSAHDIPVGATATIGLSGSEGAAYLVSSSMLALDDGGKVGVKLVDDSGTVRFHYVDLLGTTDDGLWIGGLPDRIKLITQGQAFVSAGQKVSAQGSAAP